MKQLLLVFFVWISTCTIAAAIPDLQIYSPEEGVYYDPDSESWIIPYVSYDLWIIGANVEIFDVKIAFAVPNDQNGSITITRERGATTTRVTLDESVMGVEQTPYNEAIYNGEDPFFVASGTPLMGDGQEVPGGGVFPSSYYQYYLGDFHPTETVHNYTPGSEEDTALGEIMKLSIVVEGYSMASMIAYDHIVFGKNKARYIKTPYSHDGESTTAVPEPATMMLFSLGLAGIAGRSAFNGKRASVFSSKG